MLLHCASSLRAVLFCVCACVPVPVCLSVPVPVPVPAAPTDDTHPGFCRVPGTPLVKSTGCPMLFTCNHAVSRHCDASRLHSPAPPPKTPQLVRGWALTPPSKPWMGRPWMAWVVTTARRPTRQWDSPVGTVVVVAAQRLAPCLWVTALCRHRRCPLPYSRHRHRVGPCHRLATLGLVVPPMRQTPRCHSNQAPLVVVVVGAVEVGLPRRCLPSPPHPQPDPAVAAPQARRLTRSLARSTTLVAVQPLVAAVAVVVVLELPLLRTLPLRT